jgi:hypothetical protein
MQKMVKVRVARTAAASEWRSSVAPRFQHFYVKPCQRRANAVSTVGPLLSYLYSPIHDNINILGLSYACLHVIDERMRPKVTAVIPNFKAEPAYTILYSCSPNLAKSFQTSSCVVPFGVLSSAAWQ